MKLDPERANKYKDGLQLKLRMHQLDDYFFRNQKERLKELAIFYISLRNEELSLYENELNIEIKKWPDGSLDQPLSLGHLLEARRIYALHATELMQYIFDYERNIISTYCATQNNNEKQQKLLQYAKTKNRDRLYIGFGNDVLQWDNTNGKEVKETLRKLRNSCLHHIIPTNGSFRQLTMPNSPVGQALHIYTRLGKDKGEPNEYDSL